MGVGRGANHLRQIGIEAVLLVWLSLPTRDRVRNRPSFLCTVDLEMAFFVMELGPEVSTLRTVPGLWKALARRQKLAAGI